MSAAATLPQINQRDPSWMEDDRPTHTLVLPEIAAPTGAQRNLKQLPVSASTARRPVQDRDLQLLDYTIGKNLGMGAFGKVRVL